ncbi:MAG: hypothetical protein U1E45_20715 [Geminicoccaceae bacterium]
MGTTVAAEALGGLRLGAVAALLAALPLGPAAALATGEVRTRDVTLAGKTVPLPDGDWIVAGLSSQNLDLEGVGAFGAIENAILFHREGDRVTAVAEINTNAVPVDDGWGIASSCVPGEQYLLVNRYRTRWDDSCVFVAPTFAPAGNTGPKAWGEAQRAAALSGWSMPELWVTAGFRVSDRQDVVDVRYHFAPEALGYTASKSGIERTSWRAEALGPSSARKEAAQVLMAWAVGMDDRIENGLRGLPMARLRMPLRAALFPGTPQLDAKLASLEDLYAQGRLSGADLIAQERAATVETAPPAPVEDPLQRSIEKSLSYRLVGSAIDYASSLFTTVTAPAAGFLASAGAVATSGIFVLNDRLWDRAASPPPTSPPPVIDFVHLGMPA